MNSALALLVIGCGAQAGDESSFEVERATEALGGKFYVVRGTADRAEGSLRSTIDAVNSQHAGDAVIVLRPGSYDLTGCGADDSNLGGDLDITTDAAVSLVGVGPDVTIRQTCAGERVLDARGTGTLTLSRVTVTGGSLADTSTETARGGGIRARSDVVLDRARITGNTAKGEGALGEIAAAQGGGLYVGGALRGIGAVIAGNKVVAGIQPDEMPPDASFAGPAEGGGAYVGGAIEMLGGSVSDNEALGAFVRGDAPRKPQPGLARGGGVAQAMSSAAPVSFRGTRFSGNSAVGGSGYFAGAAEGGALATAGPLTARDISATGNRALGGGVGVQTSGTANGGALASRGTAQLTASTISGNVAQSGNAYVSPTCPMRCYAQMASPATGGGVWAMGQLTLTRCTFDANGIGLGTGSPPSPPSRGGAAASDGALIVRGGAYTNNGGPGRGGALSGIDVSLQRVTLSGNQATMTASAALPYILPTLGAGGAVEAQTLTADGIDAFDNEVQGPSGGALLVAGDATIRGSSIRNNRVLHYPIGVPPQGGGAGVRVGGTLTVSNSTFTGNGGTAFRAPVCFPPFSCIPTFVGGGIWAGSVQGQNVTLASNYALGFSIGAPYTAAPSGGGAIAAAGEISLVNATLTGNLVTGAFGPSSSYLPGQGSAVLAATLSLEQTTVLDNDGVDTDLPDSLATATPVHVPSLAARSLATSRSAVIAPSGAPVCSPATAVVASSYNWFSDVSCALTGVGDQQDTASIVFGPLADNGGPVQTRAPAPGSSLIDYIPASACPITTDARGVPRPQGAACDVGALESCTRETCRGGLECWLRCQPR